MSYKQGQGKRSESFIPNRVREIEREVLSLSSVKEQQHWLKYLHQFSPKSYQGKCGCWKDCPKSSRCTAFVMPTGKILVDIKFSSRWRIQYRLFYVIQLAFSLTHLRFLSGSLVRDTITKHTFISLKMNTAFPVSVMETLM